MSGFEKTIVCLANSRKAPSGRCVAGREFSMGRLGSWVRPVSARSTRELSLEERRCQGGRDPQVLDIIRIGFAQPEPDAYQTENCVIDAACRWKRTGAASFSVLEQAVEEIKGPLWLNRNSSAHGENDRVAAHEAAKFSRSLYLIRPSKLRLIVASETTDHAPKARRRVRARFHLSGHQYCFGVTDPLIEKEYLAEPDGEYPLAEALICVSLGEVFQGHAYKLAASIITPDREKGKRWRIPFIR